MLGLMDLGVVHTRAHHFEDGEGLVQQVILHDVADRALHVFLHLLPVEEHLPFPPHHAVAQQYISHSKFKQNYDAFRVMKLKTLCCRAGHSI